MKKIKNQNIIVGIYMVLTIVAGLTCMGVACLFVTDLYGLFVVAAIIASLSSICWTIWQDHKRVNL